MSITELAPTTQHINATWRQSTEPSVKLLPEKVPSVAFDINLKNHLKPGEVIDFDYHEFDKEARAMGATDKDIVDANINILERAGEGIEDMYERPGEDSDGHFMRPDDDKPSHVSIAYTNKDPQKLNRRLAHEFRHYLDYNAGISPKELPREYLKAREMASMNDAKDRIKISLLAGLAMGAGFYADSPRTVAIGAAANAYALLQGARALRYVSKHYTNNPDEVRAREAEKQHGHMQVIGKKQT